ncbi:MAG: PA0069 family radical SAM protein [Bacteroidota bacterium]
MSSHSIPIRGRGASYNPENRFEDGALIEYDQHEQTGEVPVSKTQLIRDDTKNVISFNKSPDIPFEAGLNPYRGCEHGCIYCFARSYHEYLGFSSGVDFESKIVVKYDAASRLKQTLQSPKWKPQVIAMSGITDIYQPIERKLKITRGCLEVLAEFRNPVGMITKNHLITRDIDLLKQLNEFNCVKVMISITSLDKSLTEIMEPRTSRPVRRFKAIEELAKAGIPVGVNVAPIIPGLTDHELVGILESSARAGASYAGFTIIRFPYQVKDLFMKWLDDHFPDRKNKVFNKIKNMRNGKLNNNEFGKRNSGEGSYAQQIKDQFALHTQRLGLNQRSFPLKTEHFIRTEGVQLDFF